MRLLLSVNSRLLLLAAGLMVVSWTAAGAQVIQPGSVTVKLDTVAQINTGIAGPPLDLLQPIGDSANGNRLFVATQGGQIDLVKNGTLESTPFANITSILNSAGVNLNFDGEAGLIGMAFHPDFDVPGSAGFGKFYTYTSETPVGSPTFSHPELTPTGSGSITFQNVLREWSTAPGSDTLTNTGSRVLFSVAKQQNNHNGGGMMFGPNNYLYLGIGDGGGGDDIGPTASTDGHTNNIGNGQDITNVYGKMLRIDPLAPSATPTSTDPVSGNGNYRVPASNPFVGPTTGADEVFLYGLRNPFRFSFDNASPNDLYIGDVGQGQEEEVDLVHVNNITGSNNNFGWPFLEGTLDNPNYSQSGAGSVPPIATYMHAGNGIAIQGGFIYHGTLIPELDGKYVFGDLQGQLFYMDASGGTIQSLMIDPSGVQLPGNLYSYGEDQAGELYTMWGDGSVLKLVPEPATAGILGLFIVGSLFGWRRRTAR